MVSLTHFILFSVLLSNLELPVYQPILLGISPEAKTKLMFNRPMTVIGQGQSRKAPLM